jgi:tctex1 domain-containing protein 2
MAQVSSSASTGEDAVLKLSYKEKVPVVAMKQIISKCLQDKLTGFQYDGEKCNEAAKQLSDQIRIELKSMGYDRYKFIVQVLIGERREQGMHFGSRCFWDSNTDNQASESFTNVRLVPFRFTL